MTQTENLNENLIHMSTDDRAKALDGGTYVIMAPALYAGLRDKWTTSLRSGEYEQGQMGLREASPGGNKYCCLGLLCDISGMGAWGSWEGVDDAGPYFTLPLFPDARDDLYIPEPLARALGLDARGVIGIIRSRGIVPEVLSLASLNDSEFTFSQIADVIDFFLS